MIDDRSFGQSALLLAHSTERMLCQEVEACFLPTSRIAASMRAEPFAYCQKRLNFDGVALV
jgi:hypothetical protein